MNSEPQDVRVATLRPGTGRPVVVVDFNEFTARRTLSELVSETGSDRALFRIDAVNGPAAGTGRGIAELADAYAAELNRMEVRPDVVLGYCSAATLALHLARALAGGDGGRLPRTILVEPSWMTPEIIGEDVAALCAKLAGGPVEEYGGELSEEAILRRLRAALTEKLRADAVPEADIEFCLPHLTDRYRAWFGFLLRTLGTPVPAGILPDAVVLGDDGQRFLHPDWPADRVRVERLALPTGALLADAATGPLLERLMTGGVGPGTGVAVGEPAAGDGARITDLLRHRFESNEHDPAVSDEHETLTYGELARRAQALAERLRGLGVTRDVPVALLAERSVGLAVAIVAVLLADGAYLPLDPSWPADRVGHILGEARPRVSMVQEGAAATGLPALAGMSVVGLDGAPLAPERPGGRPEHGGPGDGGPGDGDLAYVMYTSGSTGRPKGVAVPHRGLVNRIRWMQERFPLAVGDAVLQKTPYTFDVSVWEFLWPLTAGARLVMARPGGHRDPEYLAETIRRESIDVVHFVPSMLDVFLAHAEPFSCPSLRHVIASGEALSPATANRFADSHAASLHNLYGPTEASIDVTHWTCRRPEPGPTVPIGRPIRGVRLSVRDESGHGVPAGTVGELFLGGVCLARGYLARPDLTAASFVEDPDSPGERLYRTGDLVRWNEEGALEFHGRRDHQVKLRGLRLEPGEVESVACEHPEVRSAVAVVRRDGGTDPRLVLYVTPLLDAGSVVAVRAHLAARLAEQCVPSAIVPLAALPLTANGKCDRAALPAPAYEGLGRGATRRRPRPRS
ncbi:amino acid adenylation domain-containing protein [Streptomyces sp. NPDC048514]|uniref:amino acid adenylation domain-containing protein n=1 Tax=Streptomyces sp. NPDC048514 TaxID=3365564 RepID=UPI00370FB085